MCYLHALFNWAMSCFFTFLSFGLDTSDFLTQIGTIKVACIRCMLRLFGKKVFVNCYVKLAYYTYIQRHTSGAIDFY